MRVRAVQRWSAIAVKVTARHHHSRPGVLVRASAGSAARGSKGRMKRPQGFEGMKKRSEFVTTQAESAYPDATRNRAERPGYRCVKRQLRTGSARKRPTQAQRAKA